MPKGELRRGFRKVAGVATDDVYAELQTFRRENGLPNMSQALKAALSQWRETCRKGVQNPTEGPHADGGSSDDSGVQNPSAGPAEGS